MLVLMPSPAVLVGQIMRWVCVTVISMCCGVYVEWGFGVAHRRAQPRQSFAVLHSTSLFSIGVSQTMVTKDPI